MKNKIIGILLLLSLLGIFVLNSFHEDYPDEYDSILGGKFITQGKLPYRDWFQHHQPGAYLYSAILLPFTGQSFVKFRFALGISFFALSIFSFYLLKKRIKKEIRFYWLFLFLSAIAATYYWGQMILADTLSSMLILPAYALVILKTLYGERFEKKDLLIVSLFGFFAWFTSMTYLYVIAGLIAYALLLFIRWELKSNTSIKKILISAGLILSTPYILFFIYLLFTGSLSDYYFSNVIYNQYYIYNYPHPYGGRINPVRLAIVIFNDFLGNFFPAINQVFSFNFADPLAPTLALSNLFMFIFFILKKQYMLLLPLLTTVIFANARSNPSFIKETDYQASVYILVSLFNGITTLYFLKATINEEAENFKKMGALFLLLILGSYSVFNAYYLFMKFEQKFYPKYMGTAPLIYNYPQVAKTVNRITTKDDYAYIGPFEFKEIFFLDKAKMPSKYHWFLQHAAVLKIKDELVSDLKRNRPKVIVFKRNYSPWGGKPEEFNYFMVDFLKKDYFRIMDINSTFKDYNLKWVEGNTRNFDWDADFHFDIRRKDEILKELVDKGILVKKPK